ncbi:flagellar hook-basal body complex protein FliE [Cohnella sp. CFH 77786]|uniref:flagellar hook-basal body complex protein FliE n=1 Tax=Cohnella sp. CFH 77786 TaxID=2662265 RepID=UPI001C610FD5|nr:flagellar hook-basal body complex protein FliE [Cohnella sp. CFH 77786]MBW5444579.1 flagellar hook-basal body complex protein FliE [Cohnella sp. CFH 77786]
MIQNAMLAPASLSMLQQTTPAAAKATPAEATESFASFLKTALDSVAAQENNVHTVTDQFIIGQADVNDVMIASSKAELSLSLTSQVRNKVIEAYQEIMRMQM